MYVVFQLNSAISHTVCGRLRAFVQRVSGLHCSCCGNGGGTDGIVIVAAKEALGSDEATMTRPPLPPPLQLVATATS